MGKKQLTSDLSHTKAYRSIQALRLAELKKKLEEIVCANPDCSDYVYKDSILCWICFCSYGFKPKMYSRIKNRNESGGKVNFNIGFLMD